MSPRQPYYKTPFFCLGFDPGVATTGYGVVECRKDGIACVGYGVIRTSQNIPLPERLRKLHRLAGAIISRYRPALIGVESLIFAKNVKTGIIVGEARGVLLLAIAEAGTDLLELTPLQVKQALTSYGRADKRQVQYMVRQVLKLKSVPRPDDAADALAVAIAVAQMRSTMKL